MIRFSRAAGLDVAESAGAGAGVSKNHDRGGTSAPAFTDIRAGSFLADRVKAIGIDQGLCMEVFRTTWCLCSDPGRFSPHGELLNGCSAVVEHHRFQVDPSRTMVLASGVSAQGSRVPGLDLGGGVMNRLVAFGGHHGIVPLGSGGHLDLDPAESADHGLITL